VVTGGSRGIGRAIAERLGRDGAVVAVGYARDEEAARQVVMGIEEEGGRAFPLLARFGDHGDAAATWEHFTAAAHELGLDGGVDVLVNNAAVSRSADLASITEEAFDELFAVNVRAPFFLVKEGLRLLRDGGRIVNVSSIAARVAMPDIMAYSCTKGALTTLTVNLAKHLGRRGITVNAVAPGTTDTDGNAPWVRDNPRGRAYAASLTALGRVGRPEDIADVVAFLACDDSRWITGQTIEVTGGTGI
jgi:NAD(P)-dependent dehydrogenase (short-subunit alcohol dehydrogenase family)